MKTLILNGSPSKNGDTASLVKLLTDNLTGEFRIVDCYSAGIFPCVDCRCCRKTPVCVIDDEMQEIYHYIEKCDNIAIASPIYFSELTGKLLDAASRFQLYYSAKYIRHEPIEIKPKRGAVILAGGGSGSTQQACNTARLILSQVNAKDIFPPVCSHNTDKVPACEDRAAAEKILEIADFFNNNTNSISFC